MKKLISTITLFQFILLIGNAQVRINDQNQLFVNHDGAAIGMASFVVSKDIGFGGMFTNVDNDNGLPFYGYAVNRFVKAYSYFDSSDDKWKLFVNNQNAIEIKEDYTSINRKMGLNADQNLNSNTEFQINSNSNDFSGMYINSLDNTSGKPFYGYSINGFEKAYSYFDASDDKWKLFINNQNALEIKEDYTSINGKMGLNTDQNVNSNTEFQINSTTDGFSGMYINSHDETSGKPFYGYAVNRNYKAFSYFDSDDDKWKLWVNNQQAIEINEDYTSINRKMGLNTDQNLNSNTEFQINSTSNDFSGMHINSQDGTYGKPFYGYSINDVEKAYSYFDSFEDKWKLSINNQNALEVSNESLSIDGYLILSQGLPSSAPAGSIFYYNGRFWGMTSGGARLLDNLNPASARSASNDHSEFLQLEDKVTKLEIENDLLKKKLEELERKLNEILN